MKVTITVFTDNSAFDDPGEMDFVLKRAARKLSVNPLCVDNFKLVDSNGNTVGDVEVASS